MLEEDKKESAEKKSPKDLSRIPYLRGTPLLYGPVLIDLISGQETMEKCVQRFREHRDPLSYRAECFTIPAIKRLFTP